MKCFANPVMLYQMLSFLNLLTALGIDDSLVS